MGCINATGVNKDYKNLEETKNETNKNKAVVKEKEAPKENKPVGQPKTSPPVEKESNKMNESIIQENEPREVFSEVKNTSNIPIQQRQGDKHRRPDPTINEIKSLVYDDIMNQALGEVEGQPI